MIMEQMGEPRFRGEQLFTWLHGRGISDPDQMTNLPKAFRVKLREAGLSWPVTPATVLKARDGTRKLQLRLADGTAVETVLIPEEGKLTQCVSTQVGCAVGCLFCRSGKDGLVRNLTADEIVGQIQVARSLHADGEQLRNVVFMGIGEPLHNLEEVKRALDLIGHPKGLDLSTRRITVSTVGSVRGLDRLAKMTDGSLALAVSLHAADDETRRRLVPWATDPLRDLVAALKRFPLAKRRRITIEYVMVKGINDAPDMARKLVRLLSPLKVKVNLLPLNPHDRTDLEPPDADAVARFQEILMAKGLSVFLRKRRGEDIGAACGQLLSTSRGQPR